jgi:hypothetical protein
LAIEFGVGASFFFVDFVEVGAKDFPADEGGEFGQEVVELIDFIELVFEIEEGVLTVAHGLEKEGTN